MYGINFKMEFKDRLGRLCKVYISRRDYSGEIHSIIGCSHPFELSYNQRGGRIRSLSATLRAYATAEFNIDTLMTTDDTEFRLDYWVGSQIEFRGYIIPDFYSEVMDGDRVVQLNASDRLSALSSFGVDFSYNPRILQLLYSIFAKIDPDVTIGIAIVSYFNDNSGKSFWKDFYVSWQGLANCKDVLEDLLVATNSVLFQRQGYWWIFNEYQMHRQEGELYRPFMSVTEDYIGEVISFDSFYKGAVRELIPAYKSSSFLYKFAGGRSYPDNCQFRNYPYSVVLGRFVLIDWTAKNGFVINRTTKNIKEYTGNSGVYGTLVLGEESSIASLVIDEAYAVAGNLDTQPYLMAEIPALSASVKVSISLSARNTRQNVIGISSKGCRYPVLVLAKKSGTTLSLRSDGRFASGVRVLYIEFGGSGFDYNDVISGSLDLEGFIDDDYADYTIEIRLYGAKSYGSHAPVVVHSACVSFADGSGQGVIHKVVQTGEFSLIAEKEETMFSTLPQRGINGYLHSVSKGDKGVLMLSNGDPVLRVMGWEPIMLPLLLHCARQKSRVFSGARNKFRGDVDAIFDPTALYVDCRGDSYLLESGSYDALRCRLSGVFQEVKFVGQLRQDFIYTDFGEDKIDEFIISEGGISRKATPYMGFGGTKALAYGNAVANRWEIVGSIYFDMGDNKYYTTIDGDVLATAGFYCIEYGVNEGNARFVEVSGGGGVGSPPTVQTRNVMQIPSTPPDVDVAIGCNLISLGDYEGGSYEFGVVVGISPNPTVVDDWKIKYNSTPITSGAYTVVANDITVGHTWHFRAYATNQYGTSYGDNLTFYAG